LNKNAFTLKKNAKSIFGNAKLFNPVIQTLGRKQVEKTSLKKGYYTLKGSKLLLPTLSKLIRIE
jgi:hypothetical protein